jgi:hypothetical protein
MLAAIYLGAGDRRLAPTPLSLGYEVFAQNLIDDIVAGWQ